MSRIACYSNILLVLLWVTSSQWAGGQQTNSSDNAKNSIFGTAAHPETVEIDISDLLGHRLRSWVDFYSVDGQLRAQTELEQGVGQTKLSPGHYSAHVSVAHLGTQFLVETKPLDVKPGETAYLLVSYAEGSANLPLEKFDRDHDLVLDRVELENNTDPDDPSSIPGHERLDWPSPVLNDQAGWYVGDLHTFSRYSFGSEDVSRLIARAERAGLDFLAITDRNTLDQTRDKAFHSDKLVLIPGMEWGSDESGYALVLKPGTVPRTANDEFEAQAVLDRVVQQGGVFAPAHPCFPTTPWLRTIGYFNAVEIWCRDWRKVPPLSSSQLTQPLLAKTEGEFIFPIARAAGTAYYSANGQAEYFWRLNLNADRKAAAIGGSHSASPKVDVGAPLTYVYAENKSLDAIMRGIRLGRTMVSRDKDSPRVEFMADGLNDGKVETKIGGIVPLREETKFLINVYGGKGKRLEVLLNGEPIRTIDIPLDRFEYGFLDTPQVFSNYIVRVSEKPTDEGFGFTDMLVVTSPIYAQEIVFVDEKTGESSWVKIESSPAVPDDLPRPPDQEE